jgi:hypothetical protein
MTLTTECSVDDCTAAAHARGWCGKHYQRWRLNGDPLRVQVTAPIKDPAERLRAHSIRQGDCLIFTKGGTNSRGGHGLTTFKGKGVSAHRVAWILAHGPIPDHLWVLHSCDVPRCINVAHLRLGTAADNAHDRDSRGRAAAVRRGEQSRLAKLTEVDVITIRRRWADGCSQSALGREYGVTQSAVWRIVQGKTWRHVA